MANRLALLVLVLYALALAACETFDPAPYATLDGEVDGVMSTDPAAPLVLRFSEPIVPRTLRVRIVENVQDGEGRLLDEASPADPAGFEASTLAEFDGATSGQQRATFTLADGDRTLVIQPNDPLPLSPLLLVVEPGLEDLESNATRQRIRIEFSFILQTGGRTALPAGHYFFLINVDYLAQQLQLVTYLDVDPDNGDWRGRFTNMNRSELLNARPGCPSCPSTAPVCALHPAPSCVLASQRMLGLDELLDFTPVPDPPIGYAFLVEGFARDDAAGRAAIATRRFEIELNLGGIPINARGTLFAGQAELGGETIRGSGSVSVESVVVNGEDGGPTQGTWVAKSLSSAEVSTIESFGTSIPLP